MPNALARWVFNEIFCRCLISRQLRVEKRRVVPLSTAGFAGGLGQKFTGRHGQLTLFLPSTTSVVPADLMLGASGPPQGSWSA